MSVANAAPAQPRVKETVLVIDPHDISGRQAKLALGGPDRSVVVCLTAQDALAMLKTGAPDVVIAALDTPDLPGMRLFEAVRTRSSGVPIIVVAPHATVEGAVQALRAGAADYLGRPLSPGLLSEKVARAVGDARTARQLAQAQAQARDRWGFTHLMSLSPRMMRVFDSIRAVASTDATVLIRGETGTGKELVARAIHERSRRRDKSLISINCGAFTESLLESELFGHEKGSFTGAVGQRQGVFEMADGGSLFLDELGETSLSVQVNLLRVLEEMRFRRVGGRDTVEVDVRIIAATNLDLETAVRAGRFREDLFYRLNVFPITLPPLRDRPEDIPILMRHFLQDAASEYELEPPVVTPEAQESVMRYHWPGNVRQLRAMCERWVIQHAGAELRVDGLPTELHAAPNAPPAPDGPGAFFIDESVPLETLVARLSAQVERAYLHRLLKRFDGHVTRVGEHAGISRRKLYDRLTKLGLDRREYCPPEPDADDS